MAFACRPAAQRTPVASYMTMSASTNAMAKIGGGKAVDKVRGQQHRARYRRVGAWHAACAGETLFLKFAVFKRWMLVFKICAAHHETTATLMSGLEINIEKSNMSRNLSVKRHTNTEMRRMRTI